MAHLPILDKCLVSAGWAGGMYQLGAAVNWNTHRVIYGCMCWNVVRQITRGTPAWSGVADECSHADQERRKEGETERFSLLCWDSETGVVVYSTVWKVIASASLVVQ